MVISLYDHQAAMIEQVREAMRGSRAVLLQSPTGSGKSVLAAAMIAASREKNRRSVFCVPRVQLLTQMSRTFREFSIPHSFTAAGETFNPHAMTHIASLGTIINRLERVNPVVVFLDESHYGAGQTGRVIKYFRAKGVWVIGLSATPARVDNYGMGDWYETMVQGPSIRWLIENKFLAEYSLIQPSVKLLKGQIGGNPVEEWMKHAGGRLTIGFCRDKAHGMRSAAEFNAAGIPAAFIEADTPQEERRRIISDLTDRRILVLFNVFLCQMGFDLASQIGRRVNVRCMLDMQPTQSLTAQMQKNGRALRYDEEGAAVIIDLAGNSYAENHGCPCADRDWVLDKSDQHKWDVEFRERTLSLITCPKCFRPSKIGPTRCPYCGTAYTVDEKKIKQVDGRLIVITAEMLRAEKDQGKADKMAARRRRGYEESQCKTLEDWQALAAVRGHKPGWAYMRFTKRLAGTNGGMR